MHSIPILPARLVFLLSALFLSPLAVPRAEGGDGKEAAIAESQLELDRHIAELIQQLGAPQYATRQRAKMELKRLRLDAFDALNEAQFHDDIEIALSARYLVRSMQVNWWTDEDPPEVKQLLRNYGGRKEEERRNLMEQLAGLGREESFRPLCRLVRYEASERLSKRAALLLLMLEPPTDDTAVRQFAANLLAKAGKSKRPAAEWLRAYAELLVDAPTSHQRWINLIAKEQVELADQPDKTTKELTRELLKWYADQLAKRDRSEEAIAMMRKTIELLDAREQELLEAADWFRERKSWEILLELADRFRDTFRGSSLLQYRVANAYMQSGKPDKAEEAAQQALKTVQDDTEHHLEIAANLQHDGLFQWAEFEYRYVAKHMEDEPADALRAQLILSEMLHDDERDQAAGEILQQVVQQIESKEEIRKIVAGTLGREVSAIKSRMHYFFAQHFGQRKDFDKQREALLKGFNSDPYDADVLIAMYRVPESDAQWRKQTREKIQAAVKHFQDQLAELSERLNAARSFEDRALAQFRLALGNNQLAWLIANTEGDFDEAVRCSLRSLELAPNRAGFLDTLGHCYYAKRDFANAVKYQAQAVALEPHSPPIVKQFKVFQEALRKEQAAKAKDQDKKPTVQEDTN